MHADLTARAAAAEAAAMAAKSLLHHWATWAFITAGAAAAEQDTLPERLRTFIDHGSRNVLEEDPANAASAYRALETLDAALITWSKLAGLAPGDAGAAQA